MGTSLTHGLTDRLEGTVGYSQYETEPNGSYRASGRYTNYFRRRGGIATEHGVAQQKPLALE